MRVKRNLTRIQRHNSARTVHRFYWMQKRRLVKLRNKISKEFYNNNEFD